MILHDDNANFNLFYLNRITPDSIGETNKLVALIVTLRCWSYGGRKTRVYLVPYDLSLGAQGDKLGYAHIVGQRVTHPAQVMPNLTRLVITGRAQAVDNFEISLSLFHYHADIMLVNQ